MSTPNEADKVLEMRIRSMSYASDIRNAIAAYREEIETAIRAKHREYEKSVDRRWAETVAQYEAEISNLRAQLDIPAPRSDVIECVKAAHKTGKVVVGNPYTAPQGERSCEMCRHSDVTCVRDDEDGDCHSGIYELFEPRQSEGKEGNA